MLNGKQTIPVKWTEYLLLAWFLTLPFGGNLAGISVGFMTLYPNLVIDVILFFLTILSFRSWTSSEKLFSLFLLIWFTVAIIQSVLSKSIHADAVFDLKSLGFQFMVGCVFFGVRNKIGNAAFLRTVKTGVNAYAVVLFVAGAVEWFTTSHFAGESTRRLFELSASNSMMRAPMFIYDNVNDFLMHLIFFFSLSLILNPSLRQKSLVVLGGWIVIHLFATSADSKFGSWISLLAIVAQSVYTLVSEVKKSGAGKFVPYFVVLLFLGISIANNPVFIGPKYHNGYKYRINELSVVNIENGHYSVRPLKNILTPQEIKEVIADIDYVPEKDPKAAANLRKNLVLNGITFIKSKPLLGIGAGNYRFFSRERKDLLFTSTVDSAHCFPVEIISEFGIFGWSYFVLTGIIIFLFFKRGFFRVGQMNWLLFFVLVLPVIWCMPSSYLYLETNRMLIPLFLFFLIFPSSVIDEAESKPALK